jgi:DNA repair protein RadD
VGGDLIQCTYRWTSKECPHCKEPNDIAARYCISCKGEIVNPNDKLKADFKAMKKDPTRMQTDTVLSWEKKPMVSRTGKPMDRVDVVTPYRSFSFWVMKAPTWSKARDQRRALDSLGDQQPNTITYQKSAESGFYEIYAYNRPHDEAPR